MTQPHRRPEGDTPDLIMVRGEEAIYLLPGKSGPWLCCCGSPVDGSHDHTSCGPLVNAADATAEGFDLGGEGGEE